MTESCTKCVVNKTIPFLEERDKTFYFTLDHIFCDTGLFMIVDRFRIAFPKLPDATVIYVFDKWQAMTQPKDEAFDNIVKELGEQTNQILDDIFKENN